MSSIQPVRAIVANTSPFRLVFRSKDEEWAPTIEDINRNTYDYLKLHRQSASLDIGLPAPLCMHVAFDGSLLLPHVNDLWPIEKAVSVCNNILGNVVVGGIYFGPVAPTDIDQAVLYPTGYFRTFGLASGFQGQLRMALQSKIASPLHSILLHKARHIFARDMDKAFTAGKAICAKIPPLSPEFMLHGIASWVSHDWGSALTHLWISVEQIVEFLWQEQVIAIPLPPDITIPGRREFLSDNRTWTTSTRMELLFQKGIIPGETYAKLNIARKARNYLVHDGSLPGKDAAEAVLDGSFQLLARAIDADAIDKFAPMLKGYKELDPIERHYDGEKVIRKEDGGFWLGPLPPIPGEKEWGDKPFEDIYETARKEQIKD
jgi:hypothetical protein